MTRINNYDVHKSYDVYSLANKSSIYWPTLNCSRPLQKSTVTDLITSLVSLGTNNANLRQTVICDAFEIINDGNADIRVTVDDVEGLANQSQGHPISPGEVWCPPFRVKNFIGIYTSSNVSQKIRLTVGGYV